MNGLYQQRDDDFWPREFRDGQAVFFDEAEPDHLSAQDIYDAVLATRTDAPYFPPVPPSRPMLPRDFIKEQITRVPNRVMRRKDRKK